MQASNLITICHQRGPVIACWNNGGTKQSLIVSLAYGHDGLPIPAGTIGADGTTEVGLVYTDLEGNRVTPDPADIKLGACANSFAVDTCFLPDQYAIQWAWAGNGALQSYDPSTAQWTNYGNAVPGGYALAFKNDAVEPILYFQTGGNLYKASPDDPVNTFTLVGPTGPVATGSYPCFDFDPSGRLLVGILTGSRVAEINPVTGASTDLGQLIDVRTGSPGLYGPGDWLFDPNGNWFLMARDTLYDNLTHLFQIDTGTLEVTKISNTGAPTAGTGASWLAAGRYLLSTGSGVVYEYNSYTDAWSVFSTAPAAINDLAAQWIVPDPIRVTGLVELDESGVCDHQLYTISVNPETLEVECNPFVSNLAGKFGICEPEPNPFVSDPFAGGSGSSSSGCDTCSDQVWQEGCSNAGYTKYRVYYDAAGNALTEFVYGSITTPTATAPAGFTPVPCGTTLPPDVTVTAFCNTDTGQTVYRREEGGTVTWFNETGTITQPANLMAGECPSTDPAIVADDTNICLDGAPAIRRIIETYTPDTDGLLVLSSVQTIYFDEAGIIWDSAVDPAAAEPTGWFIGDCIRTYERYEVRVLCEIPSNFLLLVDSGGAFAKYSFYDKSITPVAIPVPSAASGTDIENYILYAVTSSNNLLAIDVNTEIQLYSIPLFTNDGSSTAFSAASFYDGVLYGADNGPGGWRVYAINVATAEVSLFNGPWSGIAGSGTSMAINPLDGRFYISGSSGRVYEVGNTAGASGAATLVYDSPGDIANGMTFDTSGNLYLTGGPNTYQIQNFPAGPEERIIDNWNPAANSIAYYEVLGQNPPCFYRKYGVTPAGDFEYLSDHYVADFAPRTIVGAVTCCELVCCGDTSGSGGGSVSAPIDQSISGGVDTQIPAGLKTVLINNLSGTNILTFANGSTFELGSGSRVDFVNYEASEGAVLPAITISGGSWQWTGTM